MNKKIKNILIGAAIGLVVGVIAGGETIPLFLIMGAGAGYSTTILLPAASAVSTSDS